MLYLREVESGTQLLNPERRSYQSLTEGVYDQNRTRTRTRTMHPRDVQDDDFSLKTFNLSVVKKVSPQQVMSMPKISKFMTLK